MLFANNLLRKKMQRNKTNVAYSRELHSWIFLTNSVFSHHISQKLRIVWVGRIAMIKPSETLSARPGYLFTKEYCTCDGFPQSSPIWEVIWLKLLLFFPWYLCNCKICIRSDSKKIVCWQKRGCAPYTPQEQSHRTPQLKNLELQERT